MELLKEKLKLNNFNLKSLFKKEKKNEIFAIDANKLNNSKCLLTDNTSLANVFFGKFLIVKFYEKFILKQTLVDIKTDFKKEKTKSILIFSFLLYMFYYFGGFKGLLGITSFLIIAMFITGLANISEFTKDKFIENYVIRIKTEEFIEKLLNKEEKEWLSNKVNNMLKEVPFVAQQNFENSKEYLFSYIELEKAYKENQLLNRLKENLEEKAILKAKQELEERKKQEEQRLLLVKNNIEKMFR